MLVECEEFQTTAR